ncbi:MAG TPA: hypothetical protein VJ836_03055 [Candidatus Saccharimonadales bacterium]|nr:hypothetical protein [Candidatus Saccharimonadales bacterium]
MQVYHNRRAAHQLRLIVTLLSPSLLSVGGAMVLTGIALGVPAISFLEGSQLLFDFFYGPYGLVTVMRDSPVVFIDLPRTILAQPWAYNATVLIFSTIIGLTVFLALQLINRATSGVTSPVLAVRHAAPRFKQSVEKEEGVRLVARALVSLIWVMYIFVTIKIVWPFCLLAVRTGIDDFGSPRGWEYLLLGSALFVAAFHVHVVALRLIALRPRLFGNADVAYT